MECHKCKVNPCSWSLKVADVSSCHADYSSIVSSRRAWKSSGLLMMLIINTLQSCIHRASKKWFNLMLAQRRFQPTPQYAEMLTRQWTGSILKWEHYHHNWSFWRQQLSFASILSSSLNQEWNDVRTFIKSPDKKITETITTVLEKYHKKLLLCQLITRL